jgi:hypothetical protein
MSAQIQKTAQQQTSTNPSIDITPLIMPISYAISGAITDRRLSASTFNLGRE